VISVLRYFACEILLIFQEELKRQTNEDQLLSVVANKGSAMAFGSLAERKLLRAGLRHTESRG
jgi:hypothetical protein